MTKPRTGITKYLSNIVDETRNFLDEMVDRARDVEHDVRETVSKAVANDEPDKQDGADAASAPGGPVPGGSGVPGATGLATAAELTDVAALVASLTAKVDELSSQIAGLANRVDELASERKAAADDRK
jgi:outer membrane murein-binding lipoprotein Lpp